MKTDIAGQRLAHGMAKNTGSLRNQNGAAAAVARRWRHRLALRQRRNGVAAASEKPADGMKA